MDTETIREHCMSLPHVTENLQWGDHLCFKIGGKLFAILPLGPEGTRLTLKASDDSFHELIEVDGIIPAPYLARAKWVALERLNALRDEELRELLRESYRLVLEKLPVKKRQQLSNGTGAKAEKAAKKKTASKKKTTSKKKTASRESS